MTLKKNNKIINTNINDQEKIKLSWTFLSKITKKIQALSLNEQQKIHSLGKILTNKMIYKHNAAEELNILKIQQEQKNTKIISRPGIVTGPNLPLNLTKESKKAKQQTQNL